MSKPVLKAKELHKSFYRPINVSILKGINLEVHPGDTVAIMGRSGEGKSTCCKYLELWTALAGVILNCRPASHTIK